MIVVDASAAVSALLNAGPARRALSDEQLHAPHLIDAEIASALRREVAGQRLESASAWTALDLWRRLALTRYPVVGLLERVWELRESLSAYDAAYIALAELLNCSLLTADARLSRASGSRCPITVVPR
ncbi:MAG: type II toxin-antitoxin system VapC family toxin [Acidimicrobiales bacterium]